MRKNLLQPEVKEEIISRISKLTPQTQRQWGKMNVNQMLYHTSAGLKIAYGAFQHIGILSLEFHVDKLSRPLL